MAAEPLGKRVGEGSANQIRTFENAKWGIILTGNLRDGNARNGVFFVEGAAVLSGILGVLRRGGFDARGICLFVGPVARTAAECRGYNRAAGPIEKRG